MASQADICNLGLANLGQNPDITSINPPDGTKYAAAAALFWNIALDKILTEYDWGFAVRVTALDAVTVDLPEAWDYSYALPASFLKPILLQDADQTDPHYGIDYEIRGGVLYCNSDDVVLRHVYRNTNTAEYSNAFVITFGALMAHFLAAPVTKDPAVSAAWLKMYQSYLATAMIDNAERSVMPTRYDTPSISARNV